MQKFIFFIFLLLLAVSMPKAQVIQKIYFDRFTHYNIDDWITYAPATDITAVEVGDDYVYFGTRLGGILRYHLYDDYWDFPFTTSSGLRSNRILALSYDSANRKLYAKTPKGIDKYNFAFQYWTPSVSIPCLRHASRIPRKSNITEKKRVRPDSLPITDLRFPNYRICLRIALICFELRMKFSIRTIESSI